MERENPTENNLPQEDGQSIETEVMATPEVVNETAPEVESPTASQPEELDSSDSDYAHMDEADIPSASEGEADEADAEGDDEGEAEDSTPRIRRGDLIEGSILTIDEHEWTIDLGEGVTGVVQARELQYLDQVVKDSLLVGQTLTVYVIKTRGTNGRPFLSISRAIEEMDWREAEMYAQTKDPYTGRIGGYNKGGLIVRFGRLRGFIPASQISQEREKRAEGDSPDQRWSGMLNEEIIVKVVEVNRQRNRLILSERATARETRERQKLRLIEELSVGEIRTGKVISLTDFGAFVDLGGADGLIHLTEMSWKHVNHPREVMNVGDEVTVKVISVDPQRKRIGLSLKSLEDDPWQEIVKQYQEKQLVQGKITKLTRFGAFASLMDNAEVEGLIHVSELADYRVEHPRDVVAVGDVLTLRVIKIDIERRRLGLSLKQVNSTKYMSSDWSSWNPSN